MNKMYYYYLGIYELLLLPLVQIQQNLLKESKIAFK